MHEQLDDFLKEHGLDDPEDSEGEAAQDPWKKGWSKYVAARESEKKGDVVRTT